MKVLRYFFLLITLAPSLLASDNIFLGRPQSSITIPSFEIHTHTEIVDEITIPIEPSSQIQNSILNWHPVIQGFLYAFFPIQRLRRPSETLISILRNFQRIVLRTYTHIQEEILILGLRELPVEEVTDTDAEIAECLKANSESIQEISFRDEEIEIEIANDQRTYPNLDWDEYYETIQRVFLRYFGTYPIYLRSHTRYKDGPIIISIEKKLGSGTYGDVYLVSFKWDDEEIELAIKEQLVGEDDFEDIGNELNVLDAMATYPYSIQYYGCVRRWSNTHLKYRYFLAFEVCEGRWLDAQGMSPIEKLKLIRTALQALQALHAHSWAHLDIHDGNLMFLDGRSRLIDFGYARLLYTGVLPALTTCGKHVPIELKKAKKRQDIVFYNKCCRYKGRSIDIFAMGLQIIQLCSSQKGSDTLLNECKCQETIKNRIVVDGDQYREFIVKDLQNLFPNFDPEFIKTLLTMISNDPCKRPDLAELIDIIQTQINLLSQQPY